MSLMQLKPLYVMQTLILRFKVVCTSNHLKPWGLHPQGSITTSIACNFGGQCNGTSKHNQVCKMTKGIILFPPKFPIGASELLGPNESLRCFAIQCFANLGINIKFLKPCYLSFVWGMQIFSLSFHTYLDMKIFFHLSISSLSMLNE